MEQTEKISNIFQNKWFKFGISILGALYSFLLGYFAYITFFYDIEYTNKVKFAIVGGIISVAFCLLTLYTRKSVFTCIFGMLNMLLFFPSLMLDWGNWPLLIPAGIVTLFGFFCCHMNETAKTVFGTIFLLMYILGGIAFYMVMNVFQVTTVDTMIDYQVSPSGQFRYYVLDVQNKASGKYAVYVQPNTLDKDNGMFKMKTTIKKMIKQVNKPAQLECSWDGEDLIINGEIYFTESTHAERSADGEVIYKIENDNWDYTYFELDYPISQTINSIKNTIEKKAEEKAAEKEAEKLREENSETETSDTETSDGSDSLESAE